MKRVKEQSKVTVAIVTHGSSTNLSRALDSVLAQTYKNIEVIILHDGDIDSISDLKNNSNFDIKVIQGPFGSVAGALNAAVSRASGSYFSWLSQDDEYTEIKIQTEVSNIHEVSESAVAVSDWVLVNPNGRPIYTYKVGALIREGAKEYLAFSQDAGLNTSAMLFPIGLIKKVLFTEMYPASRDLVVLNALASKGVKFINTGLAALKYSTLSEVHYELSNGVTASSDFASSNIVRELDYHAIVHHFGGVTEAVNGYRQMRDSSRPRSAAYLISSLVTGLILKKDHDMAKGVIVNDLSGLGGIHAEKDVEDVVSAVLSAGGKKRILFCSAHWLTGGMERVLSILFRELENDYEIFLITPYDQRQSHIEIANHVKWVQISDDNFQKHFDVMILAYALILKIDVVVGFINLFKKQLNLYELCVGSGIKTIASNHEYYFYPYKSSAHYDVVQKRLEAFLYCDAVIWPNGFNAALSGMYVQKSYVIGNPNNFEVHRAKEQKKENTVVCVGRFNDYVKRIDRILECFALIRQRVPNAKLVLVGRYDLHAPIHPQGGATLADKLNELDFPPECINFVGEVNNVEDYLVKSKVLMLTSESEGFGMVLCEAACFGVPSVCNYVPGLEDIIEDGKNGYITPQGDLEAMSARVVDILNDDSLCNMLSANAKAMAARFDAKHIGDKWRYLIDTLIAETDSSAEHKLTKSIGYEVKDYKVFSTILSKEINEIFQVSLKNRGVKSPLGGVALLASKAIGLPKRLKRNIEYEGAGRTLTKVVSRSYRILHKLIRK